MSKGAQIPELHLQIRKRWPGARQWPRLTAIVESEGGLMPAWWSEAPGISENETSILRSQPPRSATPLTCSSVRNVYCGPTETCVPKCEECVGAMKLHSTTRWCVGPPRVSSVQQVDFIDMDPLPMAISGVFQWQETEELL